MTFLDHINAKFFLAFPQTLLHLWDSIIPLALLPFSHIFKFIGTTSLLEFEFSNNFQFFLHFLFLPLFYVFFCFFFGGGAFNGWHAVIYHPSVLYTSFLTDVDSWLSYSEADEILNYLAWNPICLVHVYYKTNIISLRSSTLTHNVKCDSG